MSSQSLTPQEALDIITGEREDPETLLLRGLNLSRIANVTWFEDPDEGERIGRLALQVLERVIQESGETEVRAAAYFDAATLYSSLGDQERAIDLYRRCLEVPLDVRNRVEASYMPAEALRLAGRLELAEAAARDAARLVDERSDQWPEVLVTLGLVQRDAGQSVRARDAFTRALAALRQQARHDRELLRTIYGKLGVIDYDAGQYSTASENLREALALHHEDGADRHRILIWLGDCHLAMGARAQALAYYEEVATSPLASDEEREHTREGIRTIDQ